MTMLLGIDPTVAHVAVTTPAEVILDTVLA